MENTPKSRKEIALEILLFLLLMSVIYGRMDGNAILENTTKPLLIPVIFALNFKLQEINSNRVLLGMALLFSMMGDVFLMPLFDNFIAGLASFLVAHLFYIGLFVKLNKKRKPKGGLLYYLGSLIIISSVVKSIISSMLSNSVESFLIVAVSIYALIITIMFLTALRNYFANKTYDYKMIVLGATLFVLSDMMIAIDRFVIEFEFARTAIMTTYVLAQYFIAKHSYKNA